MKTDTLPEDLVAHYSPVPIPRPETDSFILRIEWYVNEAKRRAAVRMVEAAAAAAGGQGMSATGGEGIGRAGHGQQAH